MISTARIMATAGTLALSGCNLPKSNVTVSVQTGTMSEDGTTTPDGPRRYANVQGNWGTGFTAHFTQGQYEVVRAAATRAITATMNSNGLTGKGIVETMVDQALKPVASDNGVYVVVNQASFAATFEQITAGAANVGSLGAYVQFAREFKGINVSSSSYSYSESKGGGGFCRPTDCLPPSDGYCANPYSR